MRYAKRNQDKIDLGLDALMFIDQLKNVLYIKAVDDD